MLHAPTIEKPHAGPTRTGPQSPRENDRHAPVADHSRQPSRLAAESTGVFRPPHAGQGGTVARLQQGLGNQALLQRLSRKETGGPTTPLRPSQALGQRAADRTGPASVPAAVHAVLRTPGQPLDPADRAWMERRLGGMVPQNHVSGIATAPAPGELALGAAGDAQEQEADRIAGHALHVSEPGAAGASESAPNLDLSGVRVHTDPAAAESARDVNSLAYTVGREIVFGAGQYSPGTTAGRQLLAHELVHVVQQGLGGDSERNAVGNGALLQARRGLIQRFESEEHQHLGDVAMGATAYNLGGPNDKFELTHGDILALSGDVFMPDELFKLAAIPGNHGQKVGTRDEILWALQDERIWEMRAAKSGPYAGQKDPRFQTGGPYAGYAYSDAVKNTVFTRYQKLGADNAAHFAAPQGRDPKGTPIPAFDSAGADYRRLHEYAIKEADRAGRSGADIGMAMAREAAAQHYLTDAFSAGHLRTPAAAIREYWGNKYPLFWYNLRHKIALDTAIEMTSGTIVPTEIGYTKILAKIEAMKNDLPAVTLGDLLASVFHDVDNEQGLGTEGGGKVMGDSHLDVRTEKLAIAAIQAGSADIVTAFNLGKQMPNPVPDADLFAQVRLTGGGVGDKYAAEARMPVPSKTEPPQNWKAADINALWDQPLLGATGDTVGQTITKRVQGGSIAIQLTSLAERFPESESLLHPRASYLRGFVARLQADPKAGVLDIINWAPHGMSTGYAPYDVAADLANKGAAGDKKENLTALTLEQRVQLITGLISDGREADRDMVIEIFTSAAIPERQEIYRRIEGHVWPGDLKRSLGSRDKLYKGVEPKRADKLKDVINGIQ